MKKTLLSAILFACSPAIMANTLPFELSIKGGAIDVSKSLQLSDVGKGKNAINFDFKDKSGKKYTFDLKYKKLPSNRSYPTNLDVTVKDADGNKLGYLFFANNGVHFLKEMGEFGMIIDVDGQPVDVKFTFDADKKAQFSVAELGSERFVQDTLVPKFGFQMIRPVVIPLVEPGLRSQTYNLDSHPFAVNYTAKDMSNGVVQFQHNLYALEGGKQRLLERIYFNADSLETLREGMYAGKYFHKDSGTFKLVFYPAMGQTEPPKQ